MPEHALGRFPSKPPTSTSECDREYAGVTGSRRPVTKTRSPFIITTTTKRQDARGKTTTEATTKAKALKQTTTAAAETTTTTLRLGGYLVPCRTDQIAEVVRLVESGQARACRRRGRRRAMP